MTQARRKISERRLLIVGPDPERRTALAGAMRGADFDVIEAASNAKATRLANERIPAGMICAWPPKGVRGGVERMSRPAWILGDGPEQLSYAATSSFGV
jgi:hypothetical protein